MMDDIAHTKSVFRSFMQYTTALAICITSIFYILETRNFLCLAGLFLGGFLLPPMFSRIIGGQESATWYETLLLLITCTIIFYFLKSSILSGSNINDFLLLSELELLAISGILLHTKHHKRQGKYIAIAIPIIGGLLTFLGDYI